MNMFNLFRVILLLLRKLLAACMFTGGDFTANPIYRRADGRHLMTYVTMLFVTRSGGSLTISAVAQGRNPY